MSYTNIISNNYANIYDKLMIDIPYESWVNYLCDIKIKYKLRGSKVLDLACGTGTLSLLLRDKGYKVWSLDNSDSMLNIFKSKIKKWERIKIIKASMSNFSLAENFDLIICLFDSMNLILHRNELIKVFKNVGSHLKKDGLFVFDLINPESFKKNLYTYDKTIKNRHNEYTYSWVGKYFRNKKIHELKMHFEVNNRKLSFFEKHYRKAYYFDDIKKIINKANLKLVDIFNAFSFNFASADVERHMYFVRNIRRNNGISKTID